MKKILAGIVATLFLLPALLADTNSTDEMNVWLYVESDKPVNWYINEENLNLLMENTQSTLAAARAALNSLPREMRRIFSSYLDTVDEMLNALEEEIFKRYDPMLDTLYEETGKQWVVLDVHEKMIFEVIVPKIAELIEQIAELEEKDRYLEDKMSEKQGYSIDSDDEIVAMIEELQKLLEYIQADDENRMDILEERIRRDNENVYKTIKEYAYLLVGGGIIALIIILFIGILIGKKAR